MNILSTLWGFVILIVLFVSPQMLLWGIGIGIYGVPLGVLGAVLASMPGYRRWLVSRKGYLYISLLPGLSATQQDELRPARLLLLSLGCLVIPSLLWWLFLWSSGTFVGSDGLENAGIYAIVSLIGLALFIRWLNKGWKFNAEFSARTVDISEKSKKWSVLLQLLWPKHLMSRAFLYLTLTGFILLLLKLFGLYVTLIETILVCLPAYRFWLIRRPGYSYYLARLPGLRINAQRTIKPLKLVVATLLYLLIPSLLGIVINQVAEVFIPQNLQDYGILVFACLIAFGLLHLWLVRAWGTEA